MKKLKFLCLITLMAITSKPAFSASCLDDLNSDSEATAFLSCLQEMQDAIDDFAKKLDGFDKEPAELPRGLVAAFDLPDGCPVGWSSYDEAVSRVIVGAFMDRAAGSVDAPTEDMNGEALSARHYRFTGGTEMHRLRPEEMPSHSHVQVVGKKPENGGTGEPYPIGWGTGSSSTFRALEVGRTREAGSNTAYNNMPPFIALYYCKKE